MRESNNPIVSLPAATSHDVLSGILRDGAQRLLAQAVEAEVAEWVDGHQQVKDQHGHRQVVRNGHLPQRTLLTGVGPVEVRQPRVLDRRPAEEAEPFSSKILPPFLRKTKSLEELIPWLYLTQMRVAQVARQPRGLQERSFCDPPARDLHMYKSSKPAVTSARPLFLNLVVAERLEA